MDHRAVERSSSTSSMKCTKLGEDFKLGESLGCGSFGEVFKATNKYDRNDYAMKIVRFRSNKESVRKYSGEVQLLAKLNHPNIVRYHHSWIESSKIPTEEYDQLEWGSSEGSLSSEMEELSARNYLQTDDGEDDDEEDVPEDLKGINYLIIQMELCEKKNLRTEIDANLYMDDARLARYFKEICEGLSHIHKQNIIHRDLKPENIFLNSADVIKIGDFNLSRQVTATENHGKSTRFPSGSLTRGCGTSVYIAPEMYGTGVYNTKVDIYSLGVIYFEMCSKPMTNMEKSLIFPVIHTQWKQKTASIESPKKKSLLRSLLEPECEKRPTCDEILETLETDKSIDEIRNIMKQQNRKIPYPQIRSYASRLKQCDTYVVDCTNYFLKVASKIFELHGARDLPIPTFLPHHNYHDEYSTALIDVHGNTLSIMDNSRIAFCHYVGAKNLNKIRRYSVGKIFSYGYALPTESQECTFESVSPKKDDFVSDAEVLYIVKQITDEALKRTDDEIFYYINHIFLFNAIMKQNDIVKNNAVAFTSILMNALNKIHKSELQQKLTDLDLKSDVIQKLLFLYEPIKMTTAKKNLSGLIDQADNLVARAFKQLSTIVETACEFGVDMDNIYLAPLLITHKHNSGMMCQVALKIPPRPFSPPDLVIASGGRFDYLLRKHMGLPRRKKMSPSSPTFSAVGVSFHVDKATKAIQNRNFSRKVLPSPCYFITAQNKCSAIPVMKKLWSMGIKCDFIDKGEVRFDPFKPIGRLSINEDSILMYDHEGYMVEVPKGTFNEDCTIIV